MRPHNLPLIFLAWIFLFSPFFAYAGTISKPMANTGLLGYWDFNVGKGGGTAYDRSGNGNNGTLTNMDTAGDWVSGQIGQALDFDGSDDYVSVTAYDTSRVSVSGWVKATGVGEGDFPRIINMAGYIVTFSFTTNFGHNLNAVAFNSVRSTTNGIWDSPTSSISQNVWYHVVVTYDSSSTSNAPRIYINGVLRAVTTVAAPVGTQTSNAGTAYIGNTSATDRSWQGQIDELRYYNRVLSAEEVARLYKMSVPKYNASSVGEVTNGLIGHWTFDGNDMTPKVIDRSGQGNHGTLSGFTATTTVVGRLGQALNFDGSDDLINAQSGTSIDNLFQGGGTISAWIKTKDWGEGSFGRIANKASDTGATNGFFFSVNNSTAPTKSLRFGRDFSGANGGWNSAANSIILSQWQHVVVVYDEDSADNDPTFYINGIVSATTETDSPSGSAVSDAAQSLYIGNHSDGTRTFDGSVDDVRIYNRALAQDEIERLYQIGAPSKVGTTPTGNANLKNGLVGHWTFDGNDVAWSANKALDKSGQGNHGTITNMSTTSSPVLGRLGQALNFRNSADYINISDSASLDIPSSFTVSTWVNLTSYPAAADVYGIVSKGGNGETAALNHNYLLVIDNNIFNGAPGLGAVATIVYEDSSGTNYDAYFDITTSNFPLGNWHHVVGIFDDTANTLNVYVDGVKGVADNGATAAPNQSNQAIRVADPQTSTTSFFDGKIDDVRIYNRALSVDEIKQLYNLGR